LGGKPCPKPCHRQAKRDTDHSRHCGELPGSLLTATGPATWPSTGSSDEKRSRGYLLTFRQAQCQLRSPSRRRPDPAIRRHLKINRRRRLTKSPANHLNDSPRCQRSHSSVFSAALKPRPYLCFICIHSIFPFKIKCCVDPLRPPP